MMINLNPRVRLMAALLLPIITYGCKVMNCDGYYCATIPTPITLEIVDAQNRDLLDPQTPRHYDTTEIKQLNNNQLSGRLIYIVDKGAKTNSSGRIKLLFSGIINDKTTVYSLSSTDNDTINVKQNVKNHNCCTSYSLAEFIYNGKAVNDTLSKSHMVIVKSGK